MPTPLRLLLPAQKEDGQDDIAAVQLRLKQRLAARSWPADHDVSEEQLAKDLETSRSVLCAALILLHRDGDVHWTWGSHITIPQPRPRTHPHSPAAATPATQDSDVDDTRPQPAAKGTTP